uniref:Uncharacterized protein n=1 Tax=Arundo donax TaxID=35708 RepID=A0A0A9FVB0_ARUDO
MPPATTASRLRGAERQRGRHRREKIWVRAPSLVGRSVMISPRTASARRLIRSGPPSPRAPPPCGTSWRGDSSSSLLILALVTTPMFGIESPLVCGSNECKISKRGSKFLMKFTYQSVALEITGENGDLGEGAKT